MSAYAYSTSEPSLREVETMQTNAIAVLAAECDAAHAGKLSRSMALLGYRPEVVTSPEEVMALIRKHLFSRAVVAVEFNYQNESIIARLSRLPSIQCLIAIGPANDPEMEKHARQLGANLYLPRPVTLEALAKALRPDLTQATAPRRTDQRP